MDIINCIQYATIVYNWITFRPRTYPFFEDIYPILSNINFCLRLSAKLRASGIGMTIQPSLCADLFLSCHAMIGYFRNNKCAHLIGLQGLKFYKKSYYDKGLYRAGEF
jgi:hypothetical protein